MPTDQITAGELTADQLKLAVEVHDGLAKLVAPASPGSIDSSSFDPRRNLALFLIAICAIVSFAIFIVSILWTEHLGADGADLMAIVGAAGLGSSFYALYAASEYIQAGTYDAKYNNTYMIRLGLGILSGLILAYFLRDLLQIKGTDLSSAKNVSVAALALVGGFASDAVAQILNRVSETLVTLISGSDKDKIDTATQKAEADADKNTTQVVNDTVQKLHDAISDQDPAKVVQNVQQVVKDLLSRK